MIEKKLKISRIPLEFYCCLGNVLVSPPDDTITGFADLYLDRSAYRFSNCGFDCYSVNRQVHSAYGETRICMNSPSSWTFFIERMPPLKMHPRRRLVNTEKLVYLNGWMPRYVYAQVQHVTASSPCDFVSMIVHLHKTASPIACRRLIPVTLFLGVLLLVSVTSQDMA